MFTRDFNEMTNLSWVLRTQASHVGMDWIHVTLHLCSLDIAHVTFTVLYVVTPSHVLMPYAS
jgi:hypothetical protein